VLPWLITWTGRPMALTTGRLWLVEVATHPLGWVALLAALAALTSVVLGAKLGLSRRRRSVWRRGSTS
jgi:hypothetical protein